MHTYSSLRERTNLSPQLRPSLLSSIIWKTLRMIQFGENFRLSEKIEENT